MLSKNQAPACFHLHILSQGVMNMNKGTVLLGGNTPALSYAGQILAGSGFSVREQTGMDIQYVLLDVPSFYTDGNLRSGRSLDTMLASVPGSVVICGGNLNNPKLDTYYTIDLLQDEVYLSANAAITADCAIRVASQHLTTTLADSPALIIGWGRIGKCLAQILRSMGCDVTIAARKNTDLAMLRALGYSAINISNIAGSTSKYRLIYNTAPEKVLDVSSCRNCVKIDLASRKGLVGEDVIWARGLPGMYAPETSGKLIANTFMRLIKEVTE